MVVEEVEVVVRSCVRTRFRSYLVVEGEEEVVGEGAIVQSITVLATITK